MIKRFIVFEIEGYNAGGGWNDFIDSFDSLDEAKQRCGKESLSIYYHIVDCTTGAIVFEQ